MKIMSVNNQYNPNFGETLPLEKIQRICQRFNQYGERANALNLTLPEYYALCIRPKYLSLGNETVNMFTVVGRITSEEINDTFRSAWERVRQEISAKTVKPNN